MYDLARSYLNDPVRHAAPVLIPLKNLRKEASLASIIISHFSNSGMGEINFSRFKHLAREGKLVIIFDAFDEMADRMVWRETFGNFMALAGAAEGAGKVIITCRTHYFKDREEQSEVIEEAALTITEMTRVSRTEKPLFRAARERKADVIYLKEFSDEQIREYLRKTRGGTADRDWATIEKTYHLQNLAQRPLLLTMIVSTLDRFSKNQEINAARLYKEYTNGMGQARVQEGPSEDDPH